MYKKIGRKELRKKFVSVICSWQLIQRLLGIRSSVACLDIRHLNVQFLLFIGLHVEFCEYRRRVGAARPVTVALAESRRYSRLLLLQSIVALTFEDSL
jgi:hypothetical protein